MRPLFAYLRTIVVPTAVFAATEDFGQASGAGRSLAERIDRAADELASLIGARHRPDRAPKPPSPSRTVTPFAELLAAPARLAPRRSSDSHV